MSFASWVHTYFLGLLLILPSCLIQKHLINLTRKYNCDSHGDVPGEFTTFEFTGAGTELAHETGVIAVAKLCIMKVDQNCAEGGRTNLFTAETADYAL